MDTLLVDIDGTILNSFKSICDKCGNVVYSDKVLPVKEEIRLINQLYKTKRYRIVLWTGRSWNKYEITMKQLKKIKVSFDNLLMGKPQGSYIDADSFKSVKDFLHE